MRITQQQLRQIVKQEIKTLRSLNEAANFEDVSGMAHDAGLYDAVSALFNALLGKFTAPEEAARWLRELVEDAV